MSDLPRCRLCWREPKFYDFDGVRFYHCSKRFIDNSCPNSRTAYTEAQWRTLMTQHQAEPSLTKSIPYGHEVDGFIDELLKASGSSLGHYSIAATIEKMRDIMTRAMMYMSDKEQRPTGLTRPAEPRGGEAVRATDFLQEHDLAWLIRFCETAEDDNSYDTPKDALKRLLELGVVRSLGFGRCETTSFGDWLIEQHFEQSPSLPLKTADETSANS